VTSNSITFNLTDKYYGWEEYFKVIKRTLGLLFENEVIGKINRIGVRYISIFEKVRIFDNIVPNISFAPFDGQSSRGQFRIEIDRDDFLAIVSIVNAYPLVLENNSSDVFSVVDIDIIKAINATNETFAGVLDIIQRAHYEQKQMFFSLLKKEFINSLNPEF